MENIFQVGKKYKEITGENADLFNRDLREFEKSTTGDIVLDFADVSAISSIAMGSLFATYQNLLEEGRKVTVVNSCDKIRRLLQMVNMAQVIGMTDNA